MSKEWGKKITIQDFDIGEHLENYRSIWRVSAHCHKET